jgi:LCP family protein required for cell wall assembly
MSNNRRENENRNPIDIPNFINYKDIDDSDAYDSDVFIKEVNSSLAQQIDSGFDKDPSDNKNKPKKRKRRKSRLLLIPLYILLALLLVCGFLIFTGPGRKIVFHLVGNYIYDNFEYQPAEEAMAGGGDSSGSTGTEVRTDSHIINILLIGIEEIQGARNTDSMIIATMNTKEHSLKLTSLMRDLYVEIPGHDKSKLNSAYAKGGIELLYQTIEKNFGIPVDGYCMVNFEAFEQIVDMVGGVEITLTKKEAEYLRTTNYISKKSNRKVVAGKQLMNGNQALGYCRVRKVSTGTENNDFGRTQRQRIVLQAIYDKIRSKNIIQQVILMNNILDQVKIKTDVTQKAFNRYLEAAATLKIKELETLRIPTDGSFTNKTVKMGKYNVEVLQPKDWDATKEEIHRFINGEAKADTAD